ncbi:MAG: hypothetical protein Kilf2KO_15150 [Rhodospirillales bacterium]
MAEDDKVQGEGNRKAARAYRKDATDFAQSGEVGKQAERAKRALDEKEGAALRKAEQEGRAKAHGEDV